MTVMQDDCSDKYLEINMTGDGWHSHLSSRKLLTEDGSTHSLISLTPLIHPNKHGSVEMNKKTTEKLESAQRCIYCQVIFTAFI